MHLQRAAHAQNDDQVRYILRIGRGESLMVSSFVMLAEGLQDGVARNAFHSKWTGSRTCLPGQIEGC